ncbi:hypothetical protein [Streptomyces canus]
MRKPLVRIAPDGGTVPVSVADMWCLISTTAAIAARSLRVELSAQGGMA